MSASEPYSGSYHDIETHKMMLQDVIRTEAYERAIRHFVKPGCSVMDFGCGTGILSIFASKFGAKKVFAVDRSFFIQAAWEIAQNNNIENIDFYHCDHVEIEKELDTKVDILLSEWMGHFLFFEAMLDPLLRIRDKFLAEDGVMIPQKMSMYAGLVTDEYFFEDGAFLINNPYGVNFAPVADAPLYQSALENLNPKQMLDTVVPLGEIDMKTIEKAPERLEGKVVVNKNATIYGLAGWFSAELAPDIILGTGPDDPPTHWMQMYFPFFKPFEVKQNTQLKVVIHPPNNKIGSEPHWRWSISDGNQILDMNDLDHKEQLNPFLPVGVVSSPIDISNRDSANFNRDKNVNLSDGKEK